jgi:hypothetical protein
MSSPAWTLGSWVRIPLEAWMFVCVYSVFVLSCVGSGLATAWSLVQGVLPTVYNKKNLIRGGRGPIWAGAPLNNNNNNNNNNFKCVKSRPKSLLKQFGTSRANESDFAHWKVNNSVQLFIYLLTCLLNSPKANYKISTTKDGNKQTYTHKQRL